MLCFKSMLGANFFSDSSKRFLMDNIFMLVFPNSSFLPPTQETLNVIDPGLMDLNGSSEDALEWDETDISNKLISLNEESNDLDQEPQPVMPSLKLEEAGSEDPGYEEEHDFRGLLAESSVTGILLFS